MIPGIIEACDEFLKARGLVLNKDKTKGSDVDQGFDFLGFKVKNWRTGLRITPSKKAEDRVKDKIREVLEDTRKLPGQIVKELNPILRGWTNYYRVVSSTRSFTRMG